MSQVIEPSLADKATAALGRHAWQEAFDLLSDADATGALSPDELELLAQASWWVGRLPAAIEARERAYAAYVKAGQTLSGAATAVALARDNLLKVAYSVAGAWLNRADHLLEGADVTPVHGWLAVVRGLHAALMGKLDESLGHLSHAHEIAVRFGDRDLEAMALSEKGFVLQASGQVREGMAMLDEATVAAVAGELEPNTAGAVSCTAISACALLGDWRRAADWTEAQDRWCRREQINGFPGLCRIYRAEIKRLRGDWLEAEAEARQATDELEGYFPGAVGQALYEIGEIRLRRGDLPAAEDALLGAHARGRDPEPALSLLRLAEGNVSAAEVSIRRALDEAARQPAWWAPPDSDIYRVSLLPARVDIALAAGNVADARHAADELMSLADRFESTAIKAQAVCALGGVNLAEGDPPAAVKALRNGIQLWSELDAPWETARARVSLAQAYLADGAPERAIMELQAARAVFERLGAGADLRQADQLLVSLRGPGQAGPPRAARTRVVKTFVFTDIVDSTRLAELVGDDAWDKLIRWHDQTMRSLVAQFGGQEIKATGDGFFVTFDEPGQAIDCAIAIQRRLAEQRQAQGFAPAVRIGMHRAEAARVGLDYVGSGVNQAARIGAQARGGEILVSAATIERSRRPFTVSDRRTLDLRGISAPVEVASIDWQ